jgi:hypothetical protein
MMNHFRLINLINVVCLVSALIAACAGSGSTTAAGRTSPSNFFYSVRVQTIDGKQIPSADVKIEVSDGVSLNDVTDSTGFARVLVDASYESQPGKLTIEADGHEPYAENILLTDATLPDIIRLKPLPSTATPTTPPTNAPEPTATNTFEPTLVPADESQSPTPVPPEATPTDMPSTTVDRKFYLLPLRHIANDSTRNGYVFPPQGMLELEGVPFDFPLGQNSATTQAETLPNHPVVLRLDTDVFAPERVHLLITGGNTFARFYGQVIGKVRLSFAQGEPYEIELVAGQNIREWKLLDEQTVSSISSDQAMEVWRTEANFGGVGVIDMLTIDLPAEYRSDHLFVIKVLDTSVETVGSMDPAINLIGSTVVGN